MAGAVPHAKHGQLIASPNTLQLIGKPGEQGSLLAGAPLAVPYGQPFTLGTQRIELFASGHALGAASLLVHTEEAKLIYAGAINPRGSRLGGAIDHRSADVLVVSARYGLPRFDFKDSEQVVGRLRERIQQICADQGVALVLVDGVGKALDSADLLADADVPLFAHRSFHEAAAALHKRRVALPPIKRWNPKGSGGRVLLWPLAAREKIDLKDLPDKSQALLVSGRAQDPKGLEQAGASEGFAWSNQADHAELVHYIESTGAAQVYLTHSPDRGSALASQLPGVSIEAIGPPEQLSLF